MFAHEGVKLVFQNLVFSHHKKFWILEVVNCQEIYKNALENDIAIHKRTLRVRSSEIRQERFSRCCEKKCWEIDKLSTKYDVGSSPF